MSPALADYLAHRGDPLAAARAAVRAAPQSAEAQLEEASLFVSSRDVRNHEAAGWAYARLTKLELTPRQYAHAGAIAIALDGDLAGACRAYDEILEAAPHDLLALAVAQTFDYYLGNPASQLARANETLQSWSRTMPGYHAVLAMHAYALQECGAYEEAEAAAYRALALQPWDLRAHHAAAHVMEMQGRFEEGIRWMGSAQRALDRGGRRLHAPVVAHRALPPRARTPGAGARHLRPSHAGRLALGADRRFRAPLAPAPRGHAAGQAIPAWWRRAGRPTRRTRTARSTTCTR